MNMKYMLLNICCCQYSITLNFECVGVLSGNITYLEDKNKAVCKKMEDYF